FLARLAREGTAMLGRPSPPGCVDDQDQWRDDRGDLLEQHGTVAAQAAQLPPQAPGADARAAGCREHPALELTRLPLPGARAVAPVIAVDLSLESHPLLPVAVLTGSPMAVR